MKHLIGVLSLIFVFSWSHQAYAISTCLHSDVEEIEFSDSEIAWLVLNVGADEVNLTGTNDDIATLTVRKCASNPDVLDQMVFDTDKRGDRLRVSMTDSSIQRGGFFRWLIGQGNQYSYFRIEGSIPKSWGVEIDLGSGFARFEHVRALRFEVGSGNLEANYINGMITGELGSGDVELRSVGAITMSDIGSGDMIVREAGGDVLIEDIGSGDFTIRNLMGNLLVESLGSGDVSAYSVAGSVTVMEKGSGDVSVSDVQGEVNIDGAR
ncbi:MULTISPECIES: hypothetical protein [Gammaproteobacteria]|uniref:DUF4097 family beta strand repeat-containing protein n=1 Tax=Gammaproteobacteria TaxID=1236 RepID=UPI000DD07791|nr:MULTISPECIES: hypothetical protein [Gammaproteobacteria]RTE86382.1 hypothetical protein DQX04_07415 [Aliidiomarina sp. B3213]TCZ91730.1 hypothetical protein EYQ95_07420 [Lysobacter sp. N42]